MGALEDQTHTSIDRVCLIWIADYAFQVEDDDIRRSMESKSPTCCNDEGNR